MAQENIYKFLFIVLLALLVLGTGFKVYKYSLEKGTEKGINLGASYVINQIRITGQIPLVNNQSIQWIPIQQLCNTQP